MERHSYNFYEIIKKKKNFDQEEEGYEYLSIFFQIICSLEVAQEKLLFTHYDLHLENIMIKKKSEILSFPIHNTKYIFEKKKYSISIIDFEHSSIRYKDKIISSIQSHLFPYGYFSIFLASVDILRFLLCFQYKFFQYSFDKSHFLCSIFHFHEFILTEFYGFSFLKNKEDIKHALNYHSTIFFNCIFLPKIYKTPYELLSFLKKKEKMICKFFSVNQFPFTILSDNYLYLNFFIPKQNYSLSTFFHVIIFFKNFYTFGRSIDKIKEQFHSFSTYQSSFEYFRNKNLIPSHLFKKALKIYRYFHSIQQYLLLYEYHELLPIYVNYKKLNYIFKN